MMIRRAHLFLLLDCLLAGCGRYADRQSILKPNPLDDGRGEAKVVTFDGFWQCQAHGTGLPYDAAIQNVNINANPEEP